MLQILVVSSDTTKRTLGPKYLLLLDMQLKYYLVQIKIGYHKGSLFLKEIFLKTGSFYFIKDSYFIDFPDTFLERNKEGLHSRPCFYGFKDLSFDIYWMIPISSRVDKYKNIYKTIVSRYDKKDTLAFGYFQGVERVFLIQNMFPVIDKYIDCEYLNLSERSVSVSSTFEKELIQKARKILALVKTGRNLIFPNVLKIEDELKRILSNE